MAVVVASDGVWGRLGNEEVGRVVRTELKKGRMVEEVARTIVRRALNRGSRDNVTAIVGLVRPLREVMEVLQEGRGGRRRVFSDLGMGMGMEDMREEVRVEGKGKGKGKLRWGGKRRVRLGGRT